VDEDAGALGSTTRSTTATHCMRAISGTREIQAAGGSHRQVLGILSYPQNAVLSLAGMFTQRLLNEFQVWI